MIRQNKCLASAAAYLYDDLGCDMDNDEHDTDSAQYMNGLSDQDSIHIKWIWQAPNITLACFWMYDVL